MSLSAFGDPIHGEVVSADASGAGVACTLYDQGVTATARTLAASERVTVTDVLFISTAGGAFSFIFGTTDGAGKRIVKGLLDAKSGVLHHFETPITGPAGVVPLLIAAAGQVDLVMTGYITKQGAV
jgi:hypothetical protein